MLRILKEKLFGRNVSKSAAKSRLHVVLVQDRAGLNNEEMVDFKRELMQVIERYFVIQEKGFDIEYRREKDMTTLLINSPVVVKRHVPLDKPARAQVATRRRRRRKRSSGRNVTEAAAQND